MKSPYITPLGNHSIVVYMQSGLTFDIYGDTKEIIDSYYNELMYFCNNRKARDTGSRLDEAEQIETAVSKKSSKKFNINNIFES